MKNSLRYLKLWQKKRNELQVNGDEKTGWQEMQGLLDQHMPVSDPDDGNGSSGSKKFKLLPILLVSLSAAAMTYFAAHVVITKIHYNKQHHHKHWRQHENGLIGDSSSTDSLNTQHSVASAKDSFFALKQNAAIKNTGTGKVITGKPAQLSSATTTNTELSTTAKKNNPVELSVADKNQSGVNRQSYSKPANISPVNNKTKVNSRFLSYNNKSDAQLNAVTDHKTGNNRNSTGAAPLTNDNHSASDEFITPVSPNPGFDKIKSYRFDITSQGLTNKIVYESVFNRLKDSGRAGKNAGNSKGQNAGAKKSTSTNLDWGFLAGVNSSGSFTAKSLNSNFYGKSAVDAYLGLFATYNINDKWAVNTQIRFFNPQNISGTYTHANDSKVDSGQLLKISNTRKAYSVSVPLYVVYKATSLINFKAGPVLNFPVKQVDGGSSLQPAGISADTVYYPKAMALLSETKFTQKFTYGLSGGVSIHYQRLIFDATYFKGINGQKISSGLGSYNAYGNTLQFTIGFQLSKPKP
jgi:hypothetical protein